MLETVNIDQVFSAIKIASSKRHVLRILELNEDNRNNIRKLNDIIEKYSICIDHFYQNKIGKNDIRLRKIPEVIQLCYTYKELALAIGLIHPRTGAMSSKNYRKIKKYIEENDINISHFIYDDRTGSNLRYTHESIFCENSEVSHQTLKKRFLKIVSDYKCYICNIQCWQNKFIMLELDHINGISDDNRLENLRLVCPNCHSQTPTYSGRNAKKLT